MLRVCSPPILAALLLLVLLPATLAAPISQADPADYLPSGASVLQTAHADVDGDGLDDLVALYAIQSSFSAQARAGLLILLADDGTGQPRAIHPFGAPPTDMRGEPALDPNGRAELVLADLTGDGVAEIQLAVTVQYQEPTPRTLLWVFGREVASARPDDSGIVRPPWAGSGFRLEAFLEGATVTVLPPDPPGPSVQSRASALERETVEPRFSGPDPTVAVRERFEWRDGGFRLIERALSLPPATSEIARSPETAVLAFYEATGRGDIQAAVELLGDDLRASRSSSLMYDPSAPARAQRVEEVRTLVGSLTQRPRSKTERLIYVRVSAFDESPPPAGSDPAESPAPPPVRSTIAGTWKTLKIGDRWRLVAADLHQTANLETISALLPPGVTVEETAGGDLRRLGVEDLAILVSGPGRFSLVEPYVVFGGPHGPERSVPLASYIPDGLPGGPAGTVRVDDLNGDGAAELAFSGVVGAHSAVLWVLRWDGSTFVPLFAEASNSPVVDLDDLDGDGVPEILLGQSGYCGSYAASPHMTFVFRWDDGGYRPSSLRYPSLHDGIDERAAELTAGASGGDSSAAACVQHMLAMAHAFRGHPAETRTAYRAYAKARQHSGDGSGLFVRPIYLGAPYVEADLRAVLAAAESGQNPGWGPSERAVLHDLLGDALIERGRAYQLEAESAGERGDAEAAREARRRASEARQAATREYQAALALDPADEEARRNLGE